MVPISIPHAIMLVCSHGNQLDARDNSPNATANDYVVNNVGITVRNHRLATHELECQHKDRNFCLRSK